MTNRITDYEAGWLSFLVDSGLASREAAVEAQNRVAQAAVRELEEMRRRKRAAKKRKRKGEEGR
jgi:hypothetical protein